jgi:hypothetical protein
MYYPVAVPSHLHYGVRVNDLLTLEDKIVVREHLVAFSVRLKVTQMMHKHHVWPFLFLQRIFGVLHHSAGLKQTDRPLGMIVALLLHLMLLLEEDDLFGGSRTIMSYQVILTWIYSWF